MGGGKKHKTDEGKKGSHREGERKGETDVNEDVRGQERRVKKSAQVRRTRDRRHEEDRGPKKGHLEKVNQRNKHLVVAVDCSSDLPTAAWD